MIFSALIKNIRVWSTNNQSVEIFILKNFISKSKLAHYEYQLKNLIRRN